LPEWQRWGLAAGGVHTRINDYRFDKLAADCGRQASQLNLRESWNVNSSADLDKILSALYHNGHSALCLAECRNFRVSQNADSDMENDSEKVFHQFMLQNHDKLMEHGLAAWDLARLVNVARWGYTADYIEKDIAWEWIRLASQKM
jgi:hypothetical protein